MMRATRLPVVLPAYDAELVVRQRAALRVAALLAAAILLAFTLLDRATAPQAWLWLLGVRVVAAGLLAAIARASRTTAAPARLSVLAVAVIAATIEAAVVATGGARSPYLTSNIALLAGAGILLPLTLRDALLVQLVGLGVALVPLLPGLRAEDALPFATSASYLVTIAVVAVAGAHLQDTLRRGEHRARIEVARQMGLINLGTLAGGLAHELANPLTHVGLALDAVLEAPLDVENRGLIAEARSGVGRMRDILAAMRQGARVAGDDLREVALSDQLDQTLTLVAQRLKAANVTVAREYARDAPLVSCQPTLLGQLLVNLILNALDAMEGHPEKRLTVRVRCDGARAALEVEDTGPGVPPELRARVFEPFFSTKGEKGNGLGLWISSEIARVHGGELSALPGAKGALFRLSLPVERPRAASSAA